MQQYNKYYYRLTINNIAMIFLILCSKTYNNYAADFNNIMQQVLL